MTSLGDVDNYQQRVAGGSDDFISLSSDKEASVGSYSVKVNALASEHKLLSAAFASTEAIGEGTLSFTSGSNSFDIVTSSSDTISDIRDAINASDDNDSIIATIITDNAGQHLVLSSKSTGLANAISVTVDDVSDGTPLDNAGLSRLAYGPGAFNLGEAKAAADAQITIDDSIIVTSSSNTFTNVIDGVDIVAKKEHDVDDNISQISVSENNNNIASGLRVFIDSYNELVSLSKNLGAAGEGGSGPLSGDALLRGVMGKLRQQLSNSFDMGNGQTTSLSQLGVRSDRYGVLSLDSADLNEFIEDNVVGIQQFFVGSDTKPGFATAMDELMDFYTDSSGVIQSRISSREDQLERLDDDRISFSRKMASLEARLLSQFNAMDLLVANLNATSTYIQAQLDNMPGVVRKDRN